MEIGRQYDEEYKKQAVQLAKDVGNAAGTKEFGYSTTSSSLFHSFYCLDMISVAFTELLTFNFNQVPVGVSV